MVLRSCEAPTKSLVQGFDTARSKLAIKNSSGSALSQGKQCDYAAHVESVVLAREVSQSSLDWDSVNRERERATVRESAVS